MGLRPTPRSGASRSHLTLAAHRSPILAHRACTSSVPMGQRTMARQVPVGGVPGYADSGPARVAATERRDRLRRPLAEKAAQPEAAIPVSAKWI